MANENSSTNSSDSTSNEETLRKALLSINIQIIALLATIFAVSLTIYVLEGYKDILINGKKAKLSYRELQKYTNLITAIFLIVSIYFIFLAFENYEKEKTAANTNYLAAATLVLMAASLRFYSVRAYPSSANSADDII